MATRPGTPLPSSNWRRTRWPGLFGATMPTSTSGPARSARSGSRSRARTAAGCPARCRPRSRASQISACFSSGSSTITMSPRLAASAIETTSQAVGSRLLDGVRVLAQADDDLRARVLQVECVRVALGAVSEDRDGLAVELREVSVFVVDHRARDSSWARWTFPAALRGSSSSTDPLRRLESQALRGAVRAAVVLGRSRSTTNAVTGLPHSGSSTPITAASVTPGCSSRTASTSAAATFSPPVTIRSSSPPLAPRAGRPRSSAAVAGMQPAVAARGDHRPAHEDLAVVGDPDLRPRAAGARLLAQSASRSARPSRSCHTSAAPGSPRRAAHSSSSAGSARRPGGSCAAPGARARPASRSRASMVGTIEARRHLARLERSVHALGVEAARGPRRSSRTAPSGEDRQAADVVERQAARASGRPARPRAPRPTPARSPRSSRASARPASARRWCRSRDDGGPRRGPPPRRARRPPRPATGPSRRARERAGARGSSGR